MPRLPPPRVLVVQENAAIRLALIELLTEEGYAAFSAASLQEALALLDEYLFDLILADLYVGQSPHSFTEAHVLRRRAHATPLGILATQPLPPEDAASQGFAFLMRAPFDVELLLAMTALTIDQPLTPGKLRKAEVVQHYHAAIAASDWQTLARLCTEDVTLYPPAKLSPQAFRCLRRLRCLADVSACVAEQAPPLQLRGDAHRSRPRGLVVRYTATWIAAEARRERMTGVALYHFRGRRGRRLAWDGHRAAACAAGRRAGRAHPGTGVRSALAQRRYGRAANVFARAGVAVADQSGEQASSPPSLDARLVPGGARLRRPPGIASKGGHDLGGLRKSEGALSTRAAPLCFRCGMQCACQVSARLRSGWRECGEPPCAGPFTPGDPISPPASEGCSAGEADGSPVSHRGKECSRADTLGGCSRPTGANLRAPRSRPYPACWKVAHAGMIVAHMALLAHSLCWLSCLLDNGRSRKGTANNISSELLWDGDHTLKQTRAWLKAHQELLRENLRAAKSAAGTVTAKCC